MGGGWGLSEISDLTLIQIVFLVVTRFVEDCERVCVCVCVGGGRFVSFSCRCRMSGDWWRGKCF